MQFLADRITTRSMADAGDRPASPHLPGTSLSSAGTASILLVDDDNAVRETLGDLLELEGYRVLQASHARGALVHLQSEPVDILITDLSMPEIDGVTLIRQAKILQVDLPAILLTGYVEEPSLVAANAGTLFHMLRKPVEADHLLQQIKLMVPARQARL